ncbi:unnamed protein product [Notodromas monacha]|uniref:C-type lectin domain-containing protein n=1 Tax=Notodromas monacha TaxID=399045 RepID=A0A7R9C1Z0_9CRUS|nr:unnamed protein product [Notodromas monacha]CAG0924333.1 unnamed protein product [Notodromas monacha]
MLTGSERPLWDKVDGPTEVPQVRLPKWAADHVTVEPFDVESFENRAVERVTNRDKVMGTDLDEILQHSDAAVFGKGRSLEDAKICEPSAAENLGNQSKDEALCKFLSLDRTESNSGKIFEMLETMELPRDVSWDDPSVTGSDLSISIKGRSSRDAKNTCAVASNPEYRSFLVQRLEMSHFVSALMQFFESQQIRACLQEFKENLMNEVLSWRHFIHLHSEMVDRVHYRCLLGNDKRSGYLLSLLHRVLDYICSFCELYSSGVWKETEGKLSHSEFIPAHRVYLHFNHISQLLYRDTKMASVSFILSGLLITLSYTNGASLSDSPLFSAALATSPYGYLNLQPAPTLFQRLASAMLQRSPYDVAVKAAPEEEEDTSNVISLPIPIFVPKAGMDDFEAEQNKAKVEAIVKAVSEAVQDFKTRTSNVNDTVETRDGLSAPIPSLCSSRRKDSQFGNHNYQYSWINTPKLDWFNSRNFCRRQCMDAVSIETQAEEEYVKSILIDAWRQGRIEFIWTSGRLCDFPGCDRADLQPIRTNGWFWSGSGVGIPAIGRGYTDWGMLSGFCTLTLIELICSLLERTDGSGLGPVSEFPQSVVDIRTGVCYLGISISSGTQPDNREGGESCIAMLNPSIYNESSGQFKWHDIACGHQKHVICEDSESLLGYVRQSNPGIVL